MNDVKNQYNFDPRTGMPIHRTAPERERERCTPIDILFAWLSLLAGYLICRVFPVTEHPLGGLLFLVVLYLATYVLLLCKKVKLGVMPILLSLGAMVISPGLLLTDNALLHILIYLLALSVWCYLVFAAGGNTLEKGLSSLLPLDFLKAILVLPFTAPGKIFQALFAGRKKGGGRSFLKILLGIVIAIVPSAIVVALLSYDASFVALYGKLLNLSWLQIFSHAVSILFSIPIGMYLFGLYYASSHRKCSEFITAEGAHETARHLRVTPRLTAAAAALPILLIYGVFFASQWTVYLSAFSGTLPETLGYAEYAREGFFQLCLVSVINMLIIAALYLFVRQEDDRPAVVTRVLSLLFSAATLVLIATALAKLWLYVQRFGLTPKRIYAGWFMALLALVFLVVIIKQIFNRLRLIPITALVCAGCFAVLSLSGVDSRIAEYNVDRYLNGTLETVDVEALQELDDAAIPAVVRLVQKWDEQNGTDIRRYTTGSSADDLYNQAADLLVDAADQQEYSFYAFSLPRHRADQALREAGIARLQVFSYAEDRLKYWDEPGTQTDGFTNTDRSVCSTRDAAIRRAMKECDRSYDYSEVAWDAREGVWLVTFYDDHTLGGDLHVYLNYWGQTLMTVVGE